MTRPARKLSLHERSSPSARRGPTGEVRGQWATVDVPHSAAVSSERAGQGSVWVRFVSFFCVCVRACAFLYFFVMFSLLGSLAEPSAPELSGTCDRPIKAAWGALPFLIPGHSQINRVSVSAAVWPLSHIKSGPFGLFDLTSISHVIDSPRDLFFSPHI